jgi:hypothetical protein
MSLKRNKGVVYIHTISREKAIAKESLSEISNIFIEDDKGDRFGGFKSIQEAEKRSSRVFVSMRNGGVYKLQNYHN